MTTHQKEQLITDLVNHYKRMDKACREMDQLLGITPESKAMKPFWQAFDGYLNAVGIAVCDEAEWINWFIFDNDCGAKGLEAGSCGNEVHIKTVKQLVAIIEESK